MTRLSSGYECDMRAGRRMRKVDFCAREEKLAQTDCERGGMATMPHSCEIPRHKVFISYCHADDQEYKDALIEMEEFNYETQEFQRIFKDCSVREGNIRDEGLSSERIRRIIRDEYIRFATVLVLLCGRNARRRKHIDWEIHASMYDSRKNPKMGIVVINLPTICQSTFAADESEKRLISDFGRLVHLDTREEYEEWFPYLPARIIDNLLRGVPIAIVDWDRAISNKWILKQLIHNAHMRRGTNDYDHSAPLRRNNS